MPTLVLNVEVSFEEYAVLAKLAAQQPPKTPDDIAADIAYCVLREKIEAVARDIRRARMKADMEAE